MSNAELTAETYLNHKGHILRKRLHAVKARNKTDGNPAVRVHLPTQEEVPLQVLFTKIVVTRNKTEEFISNDYESIGQCFYRFMWFTPKVSLFLVSYILYCHQFL